MRDDVQASISMLLGVITLRLSLSSLYLNFVKPSMRPWLIASGAALLAFGAIAFLRAARPKVHEHTGEQDHHHHTPMAAWLLILPVLTLVLVVPSPLGSFAADRQANTPIANPEEFDAMPKAVSGVTALAMSDFVGRALYDEAGSLAGRTVQLIGFVSPAISDGPDFTLNRFQIACCAADARSLRVSVFGALERPATDTWVEIVGKWQQPDEFFDPLLEDPGIEAVSMKIVDQPEVPYEQ